LRKTPTGVPWCVSCVTRESANASDGVGCDGLCTSTPSSVAAHVSIEPSGRCRRPFSWSAPQRIGSPSRSTIRLTPSLSSRTNSKASSLKIGQFWKISTNALPLCAAAPRSTSLIPLLSVSIVRATNVASAPIASDSGLNGQSREPIGVDFVTLPSSLVGEYCPFVSP
jgi:hypothetical protein